MRKYLLVSLFLCVFPLGAAAQPDAVTDLAASSSVEGQVQLTWTSPAPATPVSYLVKYATCDINSSDFDASWVATYAQSWSPAASGSTENRTLTGLTPGATLYFAVKAYDGAAYGTWSSSTETGGAQNPLAHAVVADAVPAQVTGFVLARGNGLVDIAWSANGEADLKQYVVEQSSYSASEGFSAIVTILKPGTTHQAAGLVNGNAYYYRVKAEDANGNGGPYSLFASTTPFVPLGQPQFSAATAVLGPYNLKWAWSSVAYAQGYRVVNSSSGVNLSGDLSAATTYWLQTSLTQNTSSVVYVEAFNGLITSATAVRTQYTRAVAPTLPTSSETTSSISLSWYQGNPPYTRYSVCRSSVHFADDITVMSLARSTTHQDTGLTEGVTYFYNIYSYNEDGVKEGPLQYSISTARVAPAKSRFEPSLCQSGTLDGEVILRWYGSDDNGADDDSGKCAGYLIKGATDQNLLAGNFAGITDTYSGPFTITLSSAIAATQLYNRLEPVPHYFENLYPGATYYFAFQAYDAAGNYSLVSDTVAVVACDKNPLAPTEPGFVAVSSASITISWTPATFTGVDDRDKYKIYRSTYESLAAGVSVFTTTDHNQFSFTDTGLQAETTYYYRISCLDKGDQGNGLFSSVLESPYTIKIATRTPDTTPPAPVTRIGAATGASEGEIDLSWESPGDDGMGKDITGGRFRIDWDLDPGKDFAADSYHLEIATDTTPGTTNTVTIGGLGEGVTYYFRIWTADEAGNWSALSAGATAWSQYDMTPPAAAADLAATAAWRQVQLSWTAPGDDGSAKDLNGQYEIRISTDGAIDDETKWEAVPAGPYRIQYSTHVAAGTPETALVTGLVNGTTYYFALKAADDRGNWSDLAFTPEVAPVNHAPAAFTLLTPAHTGISSTLQLPFSWNTAFDPDAAAGDSVAYTISYSTDAAFPFAVTVTSAGLTGTAYTAALDAGYEDRTVYWKVTATDVDGAVTACTDLFNVRINTQDSLPAEFVLASPGDGAVVGTVTPMLSWGVSNDSDPGDLVTYRIEYSQDDFVTYTSSTGISTNAFTMPPLEENATYWWRVWAVDGSTETARQCAAPFHFHVNAEQQEPLAFNLLAPAYNEILGSTETATYATFSWQGTVDPDPGETVTYRLIWSKDQDFSNSTIVTGLTTLTTTYGGFEENGIYFWKVIAVGSDGRERQSSQVFQFYEDTVKQLPGSFELLEPGYNVTISTTVIPLFSWSKAIDPDPIDDVRYIFDISLSPDFPEDLRTQAVDRGSDRYYRPLIGLSDQTTYYWRVRASGYQGNPEPVQVDPKGTYTFSSTTGTFVISMTNNPPGSFGLLSPADNGDITTKKPVFTWSKAIDSDVGASVSYAIIISSMSDFAVILESATGLSGTRYELHNQLLENRRYYWKVRAADNKNTDTDCTSVFSFYIPVMNVARAPAGFQGTLAADKMSFAIRWSPVLKNSDNSTVDDLAGYRIYRGLSPQKMVLFAAVGPEVTSWTDTDTQGGAFYYRVLAADTSDIESPLEDSPLLSSLAADTLHMMSEDLSLSIEIPPAIVQLLLADHNTYREDLSIKFEHSATLENDTTLLSYHIKVLKADGAEVGRISFDQPLVLTFNYGAGTTAGAKLAAAKAAPRDYGNLNVFWHNGIEYLRLGGTCNSSERSIALKMTKPGEYQLRRVSRPSTFRVSSIDPPKVFTPGIAPYEKISFYVDNPDGDKVVGSVFNLRGEFAAELRANGDATSPNVILEWDGQTSDSGPAPKGVYIYQIEGSGKILNGTIMVAR